MEFENNYKAECYLAFQFDSGINELIDYLDLNLSTNARIYMEESIDNLIKEILQEIGPGEESIHNARVDYYNKRQECYSKLIQIIENEEDKLVKGIQRK